jgi:hypothetical protein
MMRRGVLLAFVFAAVLRNAVLCAGDAVEPVEPGQPQPGQPGQLVPLPHGARAMSGRIASVQSMALSHDGLRAAITSDDSILRIFDVTTCKLIQAFEDVDASAYRVCFSVDGTKLYVACEGVVRELDSQTGKELRAFEGHAGQVKALAPTMDGLRLAATDSKGIRIWELKTGREIALLEGHKVPEIPGALMSGLSIEGLAFTPDGRMLISEANDESARLWNVLSGKTIRVLDHHDGSTAAVSLSPDGAFGASTRGQGRLRLWDTAAGRYVRVIHAHALDITCNTFAPDGRSVLTGGHDMSMRVWDVETGIEVRRFLMKSPPVGVACTPDGNTAVTVSGLEGLVTWDLNAPPAEPRGNEPVTEGREAWRLLSAGSYDERVRGVMYFLDRKEEGAHELGKFFDGLAPAPGDVDQQRQLIERLNDANYALRAQAYDRLLELGAAARPQLVAALDHPSLEVRTRVAALINSIGGTQDFRGIVALETLASFHLPAARSEIERIAALHTPLSAPAKSILERLNQLPK